MKKMVIYITIFMSVILSQFIFINKVKALDYSKWEDISNFTLPTGINEENYNILIFKPSNKDCYRLLFIPKDNLYYFGSSASSYSSVFPYVPGISTHRGYGGWYSNNYYDTASLNSKVFSSVSGSGSNFSSDYVVYVNTDIYSSYYKDMGIWFNVQDMPPLLPSYLTGYKKITLPGNSYNDVRYYALSGLSSGSVFVPYDYVLQYGGGLQYQNSEGITDWSSAVEDYYIMDDEQFVRYDFDINNYPNAEFVFYTKYFYFEGTNFPSVDIYVPDDTYTSPVVVSENNQGGNDFTFSWEDQEGNVISSTQETIPVNYNPLLPSFLQEFSSDTFGLTSIITSPLTLISSITSSTCSSISIPMPFSNNNLVLPCMSDFYRSFLGNWFDTYQSISFGVVSYWVIVRIFNLIKDFKNPEHDEVEVLDL